MTSFTVGTVKQFDDPDESIYYPFSGFPNWASTSITDNGVELKIGGGMSSIALPPDRARELGYLLIKAAERHEELIKQVKLIDEQRKSLSEKQDSLIAELMK